MTLQELKTQKVTLFDEKYGAFELCDVVNAKDRERLISFLLSTIDEAWAAAQKNVPIGVEAVYGFEAGVMHGQTALRERLVKVIDDLLSKSHMSGSTADRVIALQEIKDRLLQTPVEER